MKMMKLKLHESDDFFYIKPEYIRCFYTQKDHIVLLYVPSNEGIDRAGSPHELIDICELDKLAQYFVTPLVAPEENGICKMCGRYYKCPCQQERAVMKDCFECATRKHKEIYEQYVKCSVCDKVVQLRFMDISGACPDCQAIKEMHEYTKCASCNCDIQNQYKDAIGDCSYCAAVKESDRLGE